MKKAQEFFHDFRKGPGYYLRLCFLSLFGITVVALGVFCAVRVITVGIATAQASNAAAAD